MFIQIFDPNKHYSDVRTPNITPQNIDETAVDYVELGSEEKHDKSVRLAANVREIQQSTDHAKKNKQNEFLLQSIAFTGRTVIHGDWKQRMEPCNCFKSFIIKAMVKRWCFIRNFGSSM